VTKKVYEVHVSRLRFYVDKMLTETEDLLSQVSHSRQEGDEVEKFLEVRRDKSAARFDVSIQWRGLEDSESSWEPADQVAADLPVPLKKFLKQGEDDTVANELLNYLGWK
jgi:hypothetical protein